MFFRSQYPRSPNAAKTFRSLPRTLLRSIGTSGAPRTRKYPESAPKPINCWRHTAGREMFGNSKMPSNGRSLGATAYILPEDLPKEIRPPSDSAVPGKGLYEREFAAFQKSLFERMLRETR